jgi:hypothetical protein
VGPRGAQLRAQEQQGGGGVWHTVVWPGGVVVVLHPLPPRALLLGRALGGAPLLLQLLLAVFDHQAAPRQVGQQLQQAGGQAVAGAVAVGAGRAARVGRAGDATVM